MPEKLWFEPLVWTDYRLALLFVVLVPLALSVWAFVQKNETIQHLMVIYWRVGSLLAITFYMMIAGLQISFVSSVMARVLLPISLWFWIDLNEDLQEQPKNPLKRAFSAWRWAVTLYSGVGAIAQIPFLQCSFSAPLLATRFCQVWLDPPWLYKDYFHNKTSPAFLGFLGFVGLLVYVSYLTYFVLVKLGKQGRSAIEQ